MKRIRWPISRRQETVCWSSLLARWMRSGAPPRFCVPLGPQVCSCSQLARHRALGRPLGLTSGVRKSMKGRKWAGHSIVIIKRTCFQHPPCGQNRSIKLSIPWRRITRRDHLLFSGKIGCKHKPCVRPTLRAPFRFRQVMLEHARKRVNVR